MYENKGGVSASMHHPSLRLHEFARLTMSETSDATVEVRVVCHICNRSGVLEDSSTLLCPHCSSDFIEILESSSTESHDEPSSDDARPNVRVSSLVVKIHP
jgi:hypothetical protein